MYDEDFASILICAERYALGRLTYMPSVVCQYIRKHFDALIEKDRMVIIEDISDYFRRCPVPPDLDCGDYEMWRQLMIDLEKENEKR